MASVNELSLNSASAFKYANVIVGGIMMIGAVCSSMIIGVYTAVFATIVIGMELYPLQSKHKKFLFRYAGFLYSLAGRGAFYILVGLLMGGHFFVRIILSVVVAVIGLAYIVLQIIDDPELPPSMIPPYGIHDEIDESLPILHASQED
ncbi:hypothetical protein FRC05_005594 [Tulasnella sp. 425]|nr:hypothetical protein FRC05_005594 [Tulasnella sp. 425]